MIYTEPPADFNPQFEVVSCFCEQDGRILLLRYVEHKKVQGGRWGVPAGKMHAGETLSAAIKREVWEETGFALPEDSFKYHSQVYIRYPEYDYVYHMFGTAIRAAEPVKLKADEHSEYMWLPPAEAVRIPDIILDEDTCIKLFYQLP